MKNHALKRAKALNRDGTYVVVSDNDAMTGIIDVTREIEAGLTTWWAAYNGTFASVWANDQVLIQRTMKATHEIPEQLPGSTPGNSSNLLDQQTGRQMIITGWLRSRIAYLPMGPCDGALEGVICTSNNTSPLLTVEVKFEDGSTAKFVYGSPGSLSWLYVHGSARDPQGEPWGSPQSSLGMGFGSATVGNGSFSTFITALPSGVVKSIVTTFDSNGNVSGTWSRTHWIAIPVIRL